MGRAEVAADLRQRRAGASLVFALVATLLVLPTHPAVGAAEGAGFTDIYSSPHAGYIEAVAAAHITSGCASDRYCPQRSVTRGQMATFLMKALDLLPGSLDFSDVPSSHPHATGISAIAAAAITSGYADGSFRPAEPVSRAQMATFLAKAFDLPAGTAVFADVPRAHAHAAGIAAVAAAKITTGCATPGGYCPGDPVTRAQIATFLGRALGLDPITIDYPKPPPPVVPDPGPVALVADFIRGTAHSHPFTLGSDTWKVWICEVDPGAGPDHAREHLDLNEVMHVLRSELVPYFTWLSEGRYTLRFEAGGRFDWSEYSYSSCLGEAQRRSAGAGGALVIRNTPTGGGIGTIGAICRHDACTSPTVLPGSNRGAAVGSVTVKGIEGSWLYERPRLKAVAHEIGHALGWPHSFGPQEDPTQGAMHEYSDPIDLMSGAIELVGTIAVNRFAAGWLGDGAKLHAGGTREYTIGSVGYGGTQMVLVPSSSNLAFTAVGAITARDYNANFPTPIEGVTLHRVDQRQQSCGAPGPFNWPDCRHLARRQEPIGARNTTEHVLGVGESRNIGGVTVSVLERRGDGFRVRVSGDRSDFDPLRRE